MFLFVKLLRQFLQTSSKWLYEACGNLFTQQKFWRNVSLYRMSINSFLDYKHLLQGNYLDMLELYVAPQLEGFQPWIIFQQDGAASHWVQMFVCFWMQHFQQDGAASHWGSDVRLFLDATFPTRWCSFTLGFRCSSVFGCNISKQVDWERWSDTLATTIAGYHPHLTSLYGGMLKTKCFRHQFQILQIWRQEITDAFATITEDMLENTWRELIID